MKPIKSYLRYFLVVYGLLITFNCSPQSVRIDKKDRKEIRKSQMVLNYQIMDSILNSRNFVLEADFLQNSQGYMIPVTANVNFIMVEDTTGIIQTGSSVNIGVNGIGGLTAGGNITSWEIDKDPKKMSFSLRFDLMTNLGYYNVLMKVYPNKASATITGSTSGRITWDGHLIPLYRSRVFKGQKFTPNVPVRLN